MDENTIIPLPEDGQPQKKKRGRKPKLQTENPAEEGAKPAKKRGRPRKIKPEDAAAPSEGVSEKPAEGAEPAGSGPQWRDLPPSEPEHYSPENEIFTGVDGADDFAYSKPEPGDPRESGGEIPQYFSTSDEDLDPDSYRNRPEPEGEADAAESAREAPFDALPISDPSYESFAEAEAARQDRRNGRRNWKQNSRQDNSRSAGQNPRQQNQNRQQQQQKKRPAWKQADADSEAMNPGDLPEWEALKSEAGISRWLERLFEGKPGAGPAPEIETRAGGESRRGAPDSETEPAPRAEGAEAATPQIPENSAKEGENPPAEAGNAEVKISYWDLLSGPNDSRAERPAEPESGEGGTSAAGELIPTDAAAPAPA